MIKTAANQLLLPMHLAAQDLESVIGKAMAHGVDYADVYLQARQEEGFFLEEGIVKTADFSIDQGFGMRVISGEKTGFAYANAITKTSLLEAAAAAKSIAMKGGEGRIALAHHQDIVPLYPGENPLTSLQEREKIDLLRTLDQYARSLDPRVKQVMVSLGGEYDVVLMGDSQGGLMADLRPLVHLRISVVVEDKGRREKGSAGGGQRGGYEFFTPELLKKYAEKAVRQALHNLDAVAAPAGTFPVVLGPGWPAVLLHEAIGHGLEGDFNRKGSSAFSDRLGEMVASPLCTIVDDGTIADRRGSLTVDDEGTPTECTVLIENGQLKQYMQDKLNARLMNMKPTGNGRRESYSYCPMPRMTNTYMLPGQSMPEEIIQSVNRGIYAVDFAGGQVDITSGKFVFTASEAYLIENGRVTTPIKGVTLIGNGPEVLKRVSMVGNDLELDQGLGTCGKEGQSVPVGVGQPTIKVDGMTVGGSQA